VLEDVKTILHQNIVIRIHMRVLGQQSFLDGKNNIHGKNVKHRTADFSGQNAVIGPLYEYTTNITRFLLKGKLSDSFTNYNYVGNTKVSVSIKKT